MANARILGIDAARALALLGMMATHLNSLETDAGGQSLTGFLADGRASALFATLAGVSLALGDGGPTPARPFGQMLARVAVRAVLVALVGLFLADLGTPVLVILTYYGLLFLLVAPLLRLPAPVLAGLALVWAVAGPVLSHALRRESSLESPVRSPSFEWLVSDPLGLLQALVLTGTYPAGTWLAFALAGAAVGRSRLGSRTAAAVAAIGLALTLAAAAVSRVLVDASGDALISSPSAGGPFGNGRFYGTTPTDTWWWLVIDDPHSGTPLDLIGKIGSSLLVIGVMVLATGGRRSRFWVWLWSAGSMTLTLYSLHLVMIALGVGRDGGDPGPYQAWLIQGAIVLLVGLVWRRLFRRGPLELIVAGAVDVLVPDTRRRETEAGSVSAPP